MSKENKKVSQKTVTKMTKREQKEMEELEQKIEKLSQERKKHDREWMEEGLKILGDKKSTKDLDPINFQKILENYKTELIDLWDNPYNHDEHQFSDYYFLLETFYCCSSDDIAAYLEIKPKIVDQLKKTLWE